jgi:hypothetical protein
MSEQSLQAEDGGKKIPLFQEKNVGAALFRFFFVSLQPN